MKAALINRYFDLREQRKWAAIASAAPALNAALDFKMLRIDAILFDHYGYDVSLTRTTI